MRLIDADAFKAKNAKMLNCDFPYICEETLGELIDDAPTVDAVEVVRCKDCVYFWDGVCTAHTDAICTDENEFCS